MIPFEAAPPEWPDRAVEDALRRDVANFPAGFVPGMVTIPAEVVLALLRQLDRARAKDLTHAN